MVVRTAIFSQYEASASPTPKKGRNEWESSAKCGHLQSSKGVCSKGFLRLTMTPRFLVKIHTSCTHQGGTMSLFQLSGYDPAPSHTSALGQLDLTLIFWFIHFQSWFSPGHDHWTECPNPNRDLPTSCYLQYRVSQTVLCKCICAL